MATPPADHRPGGRHVKTVLRETAETATARGDLDLGALLLYGLGGLLGFLAALMVLFPGITSSGEQISLAEWFRRTTPESVVAIFGFITAGVAIAGTVVGRERGRQQKMRIAQLEELVSTKTDLISTITHQMRTPITSIKYATKMLLNGDFGKTNDEQHAILGSMYASVENLATLTQDFLDASKLDRGTLEVVRKPQPLTAIEKNVRATLDRLKPMAEDKKITLEASLTIDSRRAVFADLAKLGQVVENLLENAIVYTPSGGRVTLTVQSDDRSCTLTVQDTGIGIPPNEQPKVFSKFFRATNARAATSAGSGIGLYLGKKYVEAHDGNLTFTSQAPGGSTFRVAIPLSPESEAEEFLVRT